MLTSTSPQIQEGLQEGWDLRVGLRQDGWEDRKGRNEPQAEAGDGSPSLVLSQRLAWHMDRSLGVRSQGGEDPR